MSPASTFATHFARLIAQRVHEPHNLDLHRAALADVLAANSAAVTLTWDNWQLRSGDEMVPAESPAVLDLLSRMAAHGVRELSFDAGTERAHILGVAWILCQDPHLGDGGARALSRLSKLGAPSVRMVTVGPPAVTPNVVAPPTPPDAAAAVPRPRRDPVNFLTARRADHRETADVLIARLAEANAPDQIGRALDALAAFTELPDRRISDVVAILAALIDEEPRFTNADSKRMFGLATRRIAKSSTFRAMAADLVSSPEKRQEYVRIFKYFGDVAAEQVIEHLAHAESLSERRVLFDTLVELHRGVPTLIYLLGDGRWYVVRNAAELLGEMRAVEAEQGLAWQINHPDERVRRSATAALAKLDTTGARAALREATHDASPDVRMTALLGLANGDKRRVATQLIRALPNETDADAQRMSMIILARLGTPDAVQYLLNAAEPGRGFFSKKPTPTRVAAVAALADVADPTALAAIRAMTHDREPEVRDAAARALPPAKARAAAHTVAEQNW